MEFKNCYMPLEIEPMIKDNKCEGGGAIQNNTVNIYIKKLVIYGEPGNYNVQYTPTLWQRVKSALGLYPTPALIERAVRREMLGEEIK